MKNFALLGTAGYVAPRHLQAIKETNNKLVASMDKSDSVGIVDKYFPNSAFFTEFERFDRHLEKFNSSSNKIDYLSICTPNHLHDAHIRYGLKLGANVICEKPLTLNPWNLESLNSLEDKTGLKVYTILQLRLLPQLIKLKERISKEPSKKHDVELSYITPRGKWYHASWKASLEKSGGVTTNIGIHLFDLLTWLFGSVVNIELHQHDHERASGYIELQNAKVKWFLSINKDHLSQIDRTASINSYRSININGEEIEFSSGFESLHTESYKQIINGNGFTIKDALPSIDLVHKIRNVKPELNSSNLHPFSNLTSGQHPFKNK